MPKLKLLKRARKPGQTRRQGRSYAVMNRFGEVRQHRFARYRRRITCAVRQFVDGCTQGSAPPSSSQRDSAPAFLFSAIGSSFPCPTRRLTPHCLHRTKPCREAPGTTTTKTKRRNPARRVGLHAGFLNGPMGTCDPQGFGGEAGPSFSDIRISVAIACRRFFLTILTDGPCAGLHAFHVVIGHRGHVMAGMGIGGRGRLARGLRARCR